MLILLPLVGIFFNSLPERAEANILLGYKQSFRHFYPANCTVGNTTYAHGQTFKLDCKTQCVCENGRHACSSLCPKEQLPAPEDTISCRSPRLVEVPGHCCKMWLCENPTADVIATCHNSSTSPWTPCSRHCGIGLSTRVTSTTRGCHKLSNTRLCEQRRCDQDDNNRGVAETNNFILKNKDLSSSVRQQLNLVNNHNKQQSKDISRDMAAPEHEHRIRKGHECRHIQRLGTARIRLGPCVSRKLYRPKLCGRCQYSSKCCVPSVSTSIQVELLCPLKANDPISYVSQEHQRQQQQEVQHHSHHQQQQQQQQQQQLWDTVSLEPIDQEFLQSHQIQIENKFIAVEWILKCECSRNEYCNSDNNNNNNNYNYYNNSDNDVGSANNNNTNNNMNDKSFQYATTIDAATDTTKTQTKERSYQQHFGSDSSNNNYDNNIETKAQEQQHQHNFASRT